MARIVKFTDEPEFAWVEQYRIGAHLSFVQRPFGDLDAEAYLEFARSDLQGDDDRSRVNAFTNAKRSIHYQVERSLWHLGFDPTTLPRSFPSRIDLLAELGLVPSGLVKRYNRQRNEIEHQYVCPDKETTGFVVELAELLALALTPQLRNIVAAMEVTVAGTKDRFWIRLVPGSHCIRIGESDVSLSLANRTEWERYLRLVANSASIADPFRA
jgi:hypothetical protein